MKFPTSVRAQLIAMVLAVTLPLTALGAYLILSEAAHSRQLAEHRVLDAAEATAEAIGQFLWDGEQTLSGMARRPLVRAMERASCEAFLGEANEVLLQYKNLFLVRADGELVCSAIAPPPGRDSGADATWYAQAVETDGFLASKPQYGRISRSWITVLAQPVRADDGSVGGYLGASVELSRFQALLQAGELEGDGVLTLAHTDRTVIVRSDDARWTGEVLPSVVGGEELTRRGRGVQRATGLEGVDRVWGYTRVPNSDWVVYAGLPANAVYADVRREALSTTVAILMLVGLLTVLAGRVYRNVTGAVHGLMEEVESAAIGQSGTVSTEGPAEIVTLAQAFNRALAAMSRAEAGLRRTKERYQSILEHAVFGVYVSTQQGRILQANPAFAEMLGYDDPEELVAAPMERFYRHPEERERLVQEAVAGQGRAVVDVEWVRKDGSSLYARLYVSKTSDLDGDIAFEVIVEDLTERRALEEQLRQSQKLEAVGRLAGGVAHDFNNRLTVIQGQAGLLLAELPDGSPGLENVEAILESARRASELTSQLLAFGRKQVARPRPLELNGVVRSLARVLPKLVGEDVLVKLDLADTPVRITADPGQIDQILLNLCTNARDAMPEGGTLIIGTDTQKPGSGERLPGGLKPRAYAVVSVIDDGHGMSEEVRSHLFEPFFTTKEEGRGTGLGLSTVYGLVKQAGGEVEVVSAPGAGAAFYVWLPAPDEDHPEPASAPGDGARGRALVVEADAALRRDLARTLAGAGYAVRVAAGPDEASSGASDPLDLLVIPLEMGDGFALRLAAELPRLRILFTASDPDATPPPVPGDTVRHDVVARTLSGGQFLGRVEALFRPTTPSRDEPRADA